MVDLAVYLICVGMVVLGALGMIRALSIAGKTRMVVACVAAAVPIAAGVWLFRSAGLKLGDLDRLMQASAGEIRQVTQSFKGEQSTRGKDLQKLLKQIP